MILFKNNTFYSADDAIMASLSGECLWARFCHESASVELVYDDDTSTMVLYSLESDECRKGHATMLMRKLTIAADVRNIPLLLTAWACRGNGRNTLTQNELVRFYLNRGFDIIKFRGPNMMEFKYTPKCQSL